MFGRLFNRAGRRADRPGSTRPPPATVVAASASTTGVPWAIPFSPLLRRLEPRVLFDGAGALTGAALLVDGDIGAEAAFPDAADALNATDAADGAQAAAPAGQPTAGQTASETTATTPAANADDNDTIADLAPLDGTASAATVQRPHLVFIDSAISSADAALLIQGLGNSAEVHQLDPAQDGLAQIAAIVDGREDVSALHIISHGTVGGFTLGAAEINGTTLADHQAALTAIGRALGPEGDLLLYGCNTGQGSAGAAFLAAIAAQTGADVAASTDLTGTAARGGDWDLEARLGTIDEPVLTLFDYTGLLDTEGLANTPSVTDATTAEDTQTTSGLVISRNSADGAEVTHFQISDITGGTLYLHDGTTAITDGTFITFAQGNAGLRFTPNANEATGGSFSVWASTSAGEEGLGGDPAIASIEVTAVPDAPSVTDTSTSEDTQSGDGALVITRNELDGDEVTHFKITAITGGTLYKSDGTTAVAAGSFITAEEAEAGLKFTPTANSTTAGSFQVRGATSASDAGLGGDTTTATITITPVADTPSVTNASTSEDTQTSSGLKISRASVDGSEVTHFKITAITGGTLYQNDGVTVIAEDSFITFAEGNAGLKFTPTANSSAEGSFLIQASTGAEDADLGGSTVTATITVAATADVPTITSASTSEDTLSTEGLVITRNEADGEDVAYFKITSISGGTLYKNDGITAITAGSFITAAEGEAGVKFMPSADSSSSGSVQVRASTTNSDTGLGADTATATITVTPVADTPSITAASTIGANQTTSGLVISRNSVDGSEVTHVKITGISGGTLYQNNGTTAITSGSFITVAEAAAGLKFTATEGRYTGDGGDAIGFNLQAATAADDDALGGSVVSASVTVHPDLAAPTVTGATTAEDTQSTSGLVITAASSDTDVVTHFKITDISGGTLFKNDGTAITDGSFITVAEGGAGLKFTPSANSTASGSFKAWSSASGDASGLGDDAATASITVTAVADTPSITSASTDEGVQTTNGLVISRNAADGTEVGYYQITGISGGTLFTSVGTQIADGDFITADEGTSGLKFTPTAGRYTNDGAGTIGFNVQASLTNAADGSGLGGSVVASAITVHPDLDPPTVSNATTVEDTSSESGLVVTPAVTDASVVTHFKVTDITGGTLYKNDGTTVINTGDFITVAEGAAGLKFMPSADRMADASIQVRAAVAASDSGLGDSDAVATGTITITPVADTPAITAADTDQGTQSSSGLVISRAAADSDEVTHFKVTGINGGTLYQNNGTTVIAEGDFITAAEGAAGLKFTPTAGRYTNDGGGTIGFNVQASTTGADAGLGGDVVAASVIVHRDLGAPTVTSASTNEDTQSTSGLVIAANTADGSAVTHFKLTNISGGTLYKNDGVTAINTGDFITAAEGAAGLKFTPDADSVTAGTVQVRAAIAANDTGLGDSDAIATGTITITPIADTPTVTDAATNEDTQTTGGLVITRAAVDGSEVSHYKITGISGGTLFKNDGTTAITEGSVITAAEGAAGLRFTPTTDAITAGSFQVWGATSAAGDGLSAEAATATITIAPIADTPSVTAATTAEDTQSSTGLVISRAAGDGAEVTHFKITGISGGTLYQNDGTTVIADGSFITFAEGNAGLKFSPTADSFADGSFLAQASISGDDDGLGGSTTSATITVTPVAETVTVTDATTAEDSQTESGLVITRGAADGTEVSHFKITGISGGTLYQHDGTTVITEGSLITLAEGEAGLKFTPSADTNTAGSFQVQGATSASGDGLSATAATATITVTPRADTPTVSTATTNEDTQSGTGLVITRASVDGDEVTHFKITGISGGTLYQNDGTTAISEGSFITAAQGSAGLKFTPSANSIAAGSFQVQASTSGADAGLGGSTATAAITVTPVADTPSVTSTTTDEDTLSDAGLVLSRSAVDASEVAYFKITGISGGTLYQHDGTTVITEGSFITAAEGEAGLRFTPATDRFSGDGQGTIGFNVQAATSADDAGLGGEVVGATVSVTPVPDAPSVTAVTTTEDEQPIDAIVITRSDVDGDEVTYYKISAISGGTLYQNDGVTAIVDGTFVSADEAEAGLRFTPAANRFTGDGQGTIGFAVQASTGASDDGVGPETTTATVTVTPIADTPSVDSVSTVEDEQTVEAIEINHNSADGAEVAYYQITGISGGTLYQNDGLTVIADGSFISAAEGAAGLKFTPDANRFTADGLGPIGFDVQASTSADVEGLGGDVVSTTIAVSPAADTPVISSTGTDQGIQTSGGLVISRNDADGEEVTHYKITGIAGGTLYRNDGVTAIATGDFITVAEGEAGLKFTPEPGRFTGEDQDPIGFDLQASTAAADSGLGGEMVTATITVHPDLPAPTMTSATTREDTQTQDGLVITVAASEPAVTHYKIVGIQGGTLYQSDGVTPIPVGSFITVAEGEAGLKFTPLADTILPGRIQVHAAIGASDDSLGAADASAHTTITIVPVADTPSVSDASAVRGSQTTGGLVISRNPVDGAEVTHYQITGITGGTLYQADGVTAINDGGFITAAEGAAGLKFTPTGGGSGGGSFQVQAATGADTGHLGGRLATATITVTEPTPVASTTGGTGLSAGDTGSTTRAVEPRVVLTSDASSSLSDLGRMVAGRGDAYRTESGLTVDTAAQAGARLLQSGPSAALSATLLPPALFPSFNAVAAPPSVLSSGTTAERALQPLLPLPGAPAHPAAAATAATGTAAGTTAPVGGRESPPLDSNADAAAAVQGQLGTLSRAQLAALFREMPTEKIVADFSRSANPLDQVVGGVLGRVAAGAPLTAAEFRRFLEAQGASQRTIAGYMAAYERVMAQTRAR